MASFTLTSFNALWGRGVDHTPFDLTRAIEAFDSDVVSLQEVWDPEAGSTTLGVDAEALGYEVIHLPLSASRVDPRPEITPHPHEASGTWGVALLTRLPVRATRLVDLGRLVERWDVAERTAILADLDVGGTTITVGTFHLSFVLPNAAAQLRRLAGYLPNDRPTVVAGDCNLWGPVVESILTGHRRAVRGRTWPAHRPHSQLDHILVSREVEVRDGSVLAPAGSDHRPVRATLRVPDAA